MNTNTIFLTGRIDTNNASEWEQKIFSSDLNNDTIFDASKLEYISSAGLRVLMKARKKLNKKISIINLSREVYDIFDVTGFIELFDVKRALREISIENCQEIGSGAYGRVYRIDPETIVKVYRPGMNLEFIKRELETAKQVFLMGVPTAISYDVVKCGDSYGVLYELLNAKTVAQIISENRELVPEMAKKCADLLKQIHSIKIDSASNLPSRKIKLSNLIKSFASYLTPDETNKILAFLDTVPDSKTFLHGDFNAKNIMIDKNGDFQLIDLGDAAYGHPIWDLLGLMLSFIYMLKYSSLSDEQKAGYLGFNFNDADIYWNSLCKEYFNLKTDQEVDELTQKFMPYMYLLLASHSVNFVGSNNKEKLQQIADRTIRENLLKFIDNTKDFNLAGEYFNA